MNNIILTVLQGAGQTVLLAGINTPGYVTPESTAQVINQTSEIRCFLVGCFAGIPRICFITCAVIMFFYDI